MVGVPCVNIAGYLRMQRGWSDGVDLNRHFPGKERGLVNNNTTIGIALFLALIAL